MIVVVVEERKVVGRGACQIMKLRQHVKKGDEGEELGDKPWNYIRAGLDIEYSKT